MHHDDCDEAGVHRARVGRRLPAAACSTRVSLATPRCRDVREPNRVRSLSEPRPLKTPDASAQRPRHLVPGLVQYEYSVPARAIGVHRHTITAGSATALYQHRTAPGLVAPDARAGLVVRRSRRGTHGLKERSLVDWTMKDERSQEKIDPEQCQYHAHNLRRYDQQTSHTRPRASVRGLVAVHSVGPFRCIGYRSLQIDLAPGSMGGDVGNSQ